MTETAQQAGSRRTGITLDQALEQEPRLRQMCDDDDRIRDLMEIARSLEGLYKSTGMHAAGVVKVMSHYGSTVDLPGRCG